MSLRIFPGLEQRSDEWHAQRRGMVTASAVSRLLSVRSASGIEVDCEECDAAAGEPCRSKVRRGGQEGTSIKTLHIGRVEAASISGLPPLIEPSTGDEARNLTLLLTAERITGHTDPTFMTDDMWRGVEDEPRAVDKYSEHYAPVTLAGFMVRDDWGFSIGYSPDGLVGDEGLVEVKSRRQKKQLSTVLFDPMPAENMAQLQCGLLVSGRQWIDYTSYCGGMPLWVHRVEPDERWFTAIVQAVRLFEESSAQMIADYQAATAGLHPTERTELEMVV